MAREISGVSGTETPASKRVTTSGCVLSSVALALISRSPLSFALPSRTEPMPQTQSRAPLCPRPKKQGHLSRCRRLLPRDEGKQISVDLILVRGRHAMRKTGIEFRCGILKQLGGKRPSISEGHDLVILSMHHQCRHIDLFEILGEVGFRKCLDTVVLRFNPAHHGLPPPVISDALPDVGAWPVVTIKRQRKILVILRAGFSRALANLIENFEWSAARILVGLDHDWWDGVDQHRFSDPSFAISSDITRDLSATRRMADVNNVTQVELFDQLVNISRVRIHLVAGYGLGGTPMASAVVRNNAITPLQTEHHLAIPVVSRQSPPMVKEHRLPD